MEPFPQGDASGSDLHKVPRDGGRCPGYGAEAVGSLSEL